MFVPALSKSDDKSEYKATGGVIWQRVYIGTYMAILPSVIESTTQSIFFEGDTSKRILQSHQTVLTCNFVADGVNQEDPWMEMQDKH